MLNNKQSFGGIYLATKGNDYKYPIFNHNSNGMTIQMSIWSGTLELSGVAAWTMIWYCMQTNVKNLLIPKKWDKKAWKMSVPKCLVSW
jgi:hypothetical protein